MVIFAAAVVAFGVLSGFGASAGANEAEGRDDPVAKLRSYVRVVAAQPDAAAIVQASAVVGDRGDPIDDLRSYVQRLDNPQADAAAEPAAAPAGELDAYAPLRAFGERLADTPPNSLANQLKLADADNAFDALREYLKRQNGTAPPEQPKASPAPAARPYVPAPVINATFVGSNVCLGCHTAEFDAFAYTLMGRLQKQGKMQCETCHGPGSVHVRSVGCAACHGDGGISRRPGMPSLVGQDPQYLVTAMKDYIDGQRKHALMKALMAGLSGGELDNIAVYYARQPVGRAQTPLIGEPAAGKGDVAICAACHGEQGVSVSPAFPSLAGQDSQYLADAIRAYRHGARNKIIACAACHGEGGVSRTAGMPSLVGLDARYLVAAMKEYAAGKRKSAVMKALLTGVSDTELNNIAAYYTAQTPARAQTPTVGDASAGKAAAATCLGCHSEQGGSSNPEWPGLAGQDARYIASATRAYKDGSRSDEIMKPLVESLDDRTINDIASYYAGLSPAKPAPSAQKAPQHEPVLSRNGLLASLDDRAINNVASYYASLAPAQPAAGKGPVRAVPAVIGTAPPADGLSVGGIVSFRTNDPGRSVADNNGICLNCHERGQRTYWAGSVHEERGLACTDCHTIMKGISAQFQLKTAFQPETCFQCHKDRRAQMFRSAHMPMREGKVVCSDCHNPHGSATEGLLWTDSINDTCYKCHAEKRGPFLFEHEPVRENCLNCHDPHGSINEASLKVSRPRLCFECHTIGPHGNLGTTGPFSDLTMSRACTNCHTMIHGSNSPAGGALQR